MILAKQAKVLEKLVVDNSPTILSAIGVVGAVTTAVLTGKASFKAAEILEDSYTTKNSAVLIPGKELPITDKVKLVWKLYIPPVGTGAVTIAAIICANRISVSRAAALAAAYKLSENRHEEYKDKIKEKLGLKKEEEARTEIAQKHVEEHPVPQQVIITGAGNVLCYDIPSDRYFQSNVEAIRSAQNDVNSKANVTGYATMRDLQESLGLTPLDWCDELGWDRDSQLAIDIGTVLTSEKQPCITIEYTAEPIRGYK